MQRSTVPLVLVLVFLAAVGAAVGWRAWTVRQDARGDETVDIPFERVQHTVTIPPEYNARATYGIEPRFVVRKRHEEEFRRLIGFYRPAIMDALQTVLSQIHYGRLQRGEGRDRMAWQIRSEVNRILGANWVEGVVLLGMGD